MFGMRLSLLTVVFLLGMEAMAGETIRQRSNAVVDGQAEDWVLKWSGPVKPVCSAMEPDQATCPCAGFAYGEQGHLILERHRAGAVVDTLELSTLFAEYDNPADAGNAALVRISRAPGDPVNAIDNPDVLRAFENTLRTRPPVDVMTLADYSQDGMQASFLLQVGNEPCGKREMALVGVSRRQPRLHVFSSTGHPERPLVLQDGAWAAVLATGGHATFTDWNCGDHGSETEREQIIDAHAGTLSVQANTYACRKDGARGPLLRSEAQ